MDNPWIAAVSALFLWWFSTGLILWRVRAADNAGQDAHLWSCLLALPLLAGGVYGAALTANDTSVGGAYLAFISALAIWGWIELAFLSGIITGPNTAVCPPTARLPERLVRAVGTIAWHEAALLAMLVVLGFISTANPMAFLTFGLLFVARVLAKLNLFLGVPRINIEFLPRPLNHLPSHFRRSRPSLFFPVSVLFLAALSNMLFGFAREATTPETTVGFALLTCLAALALLEHLFMVLPLPDQKLWRWMMPAPKPMPKD